jgi:hypothetical protein
MSRRIERAAWGQELEAFTQRNAGRRTVLEVDSPELGAQIEEQNYPLRGIAWDPRDARVSIMLGDQRGTEHHITRGIAAPDAIELLAEAGRDRALRIAHANGQTLLRLL